MSFAKDELYRSGCPADRLSVMFRREQLRRSNGRPSHSFDCLVTKSSKINIDQHH